MEGDLERAVEIALDSGADPGLKARAIEFCEEVKRSRDGWQLCVTLFGRLPESSAVVRFYALQVVEQALHDREGHGMDEAALQSLQRQIMEVVRRKNQEQGGDIGSEDPAYLSNKLAFVLVLLFTHMYPTSWPSFFSDLIGLSLSPLQPDHINPNSADFAIRTFEQVREEIADQSLARSDSENDRNTMLRDAMRDHDVQKLTSFWFKIIVQYKNSQWELTEKVLSSFAAYISWIDINLVVESSYLELLFGCLREPVYRGAACKVIRAVLRKKMKAPVKFELVKNLNLEPLILEFDPDILHAGSNSQTIDTAEDVAALINDFGVELVKLAKDTSLTSEQKLYVDNVLSKIFPLGLSFLKDEYDECCEAVIPFFRDTLLLIRRECKKGEYNDSRNKLLVPLASVVLQKLRYEDDSTWIGEDGDIDEAEEFEQMRSTLKVFLDNIAEIDAQLYCRTVKTFVINSSMKFQQKPDLDWRDIEVGLYVLLWFKGTNFVDDYSEMVSKVIESGIGTQGNSHPAIQTNFYDIISKQSSMFYYNHNQYLGPLFRSFLSDRGIHCKNMMARTRIWFMFSKFVKDNIQSLGNVSNETLNSIGGLLRIHAVVEENKGDNDSDSKIDSVFLSQLYLFEALGVVSTSIAVDNKVQLEITKQVIGPLLQQLGQNLNMDGEQAHMNIHHIILAIGSFIKGFPEISKQAQTHVLWKPIVIEALEAVLASLERLNYIEAIRDAARSCFTRAVPVLGLETLNNLPRLIDGLLLKCSTTELGDFLHFLSQLIHQFRGQVEDIIDTLLTPLLSRIFESLNKPTEGTDDMIEQTDLCKSYLAFVNVLLTNDLSQVLVSERNQADIEPVIQSVMHYAGDISDTSTEKLAFGVLNRMINVWGGPPMHSLIANGTSINGSVDADASQNNTKAAMPWFDSVVEPLSRLCFEVPAKPSFNLKHANAQAVLGEIAIVQKSIYIRKGDSFLTYLGNVYFPSANLPPELNQKYLTALAQYDLKNFKSFFIAFLQSAAGKE